MTVKHKRPSRIFAFDHAAEFEAKRAIVVPCYNEERRLDADAFLSFVDETAETTLVFVNDGSKDKTLDVLFELQAQRPSRIVVVNLMRNAGKAEAVRQGMLASIELGAETVGYWDADLATPLNAINDFSRVLDRYSETQVVFGSRRVMLGHRIERTFARRMVSRICAMLARQAVRLPIGDTQCGAKMFRTSSDLRHALERPFTAGWLFDVELFARLSSKMKNNGHAFYELPLAEWNEIPGSKIDMKTIVKSGWRMLWLIAEIRLRLPERKVQISAPVPNMTITADFTPEPIGRMAA